MSLLARRVLRTLAEAAGQPRAEDAVSAGLIVIRDAFATVLDWAVRPVWPEDEQLGQPV